jgi:hypothetical protein
MRDDFDQKTKDILAKRVGFKCSNPNCRKPTSGPSSDSDKSINVGVASHITAASEGGPRYDKNLPTQERKSVENGIWLCQTHSKLIDCDEINYTVDLIKEWKRLSEQSALLELENMVPSQNQKDFDVDLIRFYSQCLDRPAFQDHFKEEGSMESFDKAIQDTITAINTGCLMSRDGTVLFQSKGKSFIQNSKWRERMNSIVYILRALRSRYEIAVKNDEIYLGKEHEEKQFYHIKKSELAEWMDLTRNEMLELFAEICLEAEIPQLRKLNTHYYRRW